MIGYVFYSSQNKGCYELMKLMENEGMLQMFTLRTVDGMSNTDIVKLGLRAVPTIVIINNGQKSIYEKEDAFKWVHGIISNRRQNIMKQTENSRKLIQTTELRNNIKDGIFEFNINESQGLSDAYSYYNSDMTKDIDIAQPKSFLQYGKDEQYSIMTIPENPSSKYKLTSDLQNKMVSNLERVRNQQDDQIKNIFEQQQIEKVLNYDNKLA